ncbi:acyltransferase family protein [Niveibacterium sp. SC-1]|uniref:acyltransferase n=1 Tax=Niveibacterium sp. SC-1 TaxID=3135646 RepID=UPI00311D5131
MMKEIVLAEMRRNESWCSLVRVFSMLMVVALHSSGLWLTGSDVTSANWRFANAINSACRPAVPFFFMLSGYLICRGASMPFAVYARKRLWRIGPAFLLATGLALSYRAATGEHLGVSVLWSWITTPQFYHLWFFYPLAFVYVGLWLLRPTASAEPVPGIFVCFALICILDWRGESFAAFLLYAFAGYFIAATARSRQMSVLATLAGVVMLMWVYVATARVSAAAGHLDQQWYRYTSLPVVAASFLLFFAMRHLLDEIRIPRVVERASAASLLVYCGHPFIIDAISRRFPALVPEIGAPTGIALLVVVCAGTPILVHRSWRLFDIFKLFVRA